MITAARLHSCPALDANLRGDHERSETLLRVLGDPSDPRVRFDLGWHLLRRGDLQGGLQLLESGRILGCYGNPHLGASTPIYQPEVHGEDLSKRRVLLRCEGGLGDQIAHARYATDLAVRGAEVTLSCSRSLRSLLSRVEGVRAVIASPGAPHVLHDYWLPAFSAPWVLGHTFDTLPGRPYLTPDGRERAWLAYVDQAPGLKVGLRWFGNPTFEHEQHRRWNPEPLFGLPDLFGERATFYSLQRDDGADILPSDCGVFDVNDRLRTWEDTAAVVSRLDLVISSCTSVAHLAAALGVETWIVVPVLPYYLWALPGRTSPWYDAVRLYRQEVYGDWSVPLTAIVHDLEECC